MSERMEIVITTDFSQVFEEAEKGLAAMIELKKTTDETKEYVDYTVKDCLRAINSMAGAVKGIITAVAGTLDPIFAGLLDFVVTAIQLIVSVAAALASGGVTAWISVIMIGASLTLSIVSMIALATGQSDAKANLDKAGSIINSVMMGLKGFRGFF